MAKASFPWFRFYVEALHDRKLRTRPPAERWLWVALMGMAASSPVRGQVLIAEGVPADAGVIADEAAITVQEAEEGLRYFESVGMIARSDEGVWTLRAFLKRQFESDDSAERVAKHRDSNGLNSVTSPLPSRSPSVYVSDSVSVSLGKEEAFDRFYGAYPRHEGKDAARKAFAKALERTSIEVIVAGSERYRDDPNREGGFTKLPSTWLNAGCWDDDPLPARPGRAPAVKPVAQRNSDRVSAHFDRIRAAQPAEQTPALALGSGS